MKQVNLKSVHVREIRYRPSDSEPNISIFYDIADETDAIIGTRQHTIKVLELKTKVGKAVTDFFLNIATLLEDKDVK